MLNIYDSGVIAAFVHFFPLEKAAFVHSLDNIHKSIWRRWYLYGKMTSFRRISGTHVNVPVWNIHTIIILAG